MFWLTKQKFPILGNYLKVSLDKLPRIVISYCVLHNVSKYELVDERIRKELADAHEEITWTNVQGITKRQEMFYQMI